MFQLMFQIDVQYMFQLDVLYIFALVDVTHLNAHAQWYVMFITQILTSRCLYDTIGLANIYDL